MAYMLNAKIKERLSEQLGIPFEAIVGMDCEELDLAVEKSIGKKLMYNLERDERLVGRGNMNQAEGRFFSVKEALKKL